MHLCKNMGVVFILFKTFLAVILIVEGTRTAETDDKKVQYRSVPDLIAQQEYPSETHTVHTADGYILELHRIPFSAKFGKPTYGPVLVMHGMLSSSADFVVTDKGLGFYLSDAGYDVWLGNSRGNTNSRQHVSLNPAHAAFWEFSWHEMGTQDLPAIIDYVLAMTGKEKLTYVGHSQGNTEFWVMSSEKPEYNSRIRSMHALAPVSYTQHIPNPLIRMVVPFTGSLEWLAKTLGLSELLPSTEFTKKLAKLFCKDESWTQFLCTNFYFLISGYNPDQLNATIIAEVAQHLPAGASTRQLIHYGQGVLSGEFQRFDFGWWKNLQIYGQASPPKYDLKKITAPVCLYWGEKDENTSPKDIKRLADQLPNLKDSMLVENKRWTHIDFLWGNDAIELVYAPLVYNMNKFYYSTGF